MRENDPRTAVRAGCIVFVLALLTHPPDLPATDAPITEAVKRCCQNMGLPDTRFRPDSAGGSCRYGDEDDFSAETGGFGAKLESETDAKAWIERQAEPARGYFQTKTSFMGHPAIEDGSYSCEAGEAHGGIHWMEERLLFTVGLGGRFRTEECDSARAKVRQQIASARGLATRFRSCFDPEKLPPYVLTLKVDPRWLDRLGPAMTGSFDAELLYRGNEETVHDIEVEMRAPGSLLDLYPNEELIAERDVFYFHFDELKRGEPAALEKGRTPASEAGWKIYFALAGEEEPRIRMEVLTDGGSIPLEGSIEVELREGFSMTKQEVEIRIRMQDDSPARIVFPDFSGKLGAPGPVCAGGRVDEAELQYNRAGDPGWSPIRGAGVRIHAVRAGRLDEERLEDEASLGRPEKALRFFPDSALGAARNIRAYLFHFLNPKSGDLNIPVRTPSLLAGSETAFRYEDPKSYDAENGYVCIEHAYLYTAFLRVLGIPAKETNSYIRIPLRLPQTAGALVWAEADPSRTSLAWHFLDPYSYADSPSEQLDSFSLGVWVKTYHGVRAQPAQYLDLPEVTYGPFTPRNAGKGVRFHHTWEEADASPLWASYTSGCEPAPPRSTSTEQSSGLPGILPGSGESQSRDRRAVEPPSHGASSTDGPTGGERAGAARAVPPADRASGDSPSASPDPGVRSLARRGPEPVGARSIEPGRPDVEETPPPGGDSAAALSSEIRKKWVSMGGSEGPLGEIAAAETPGTAGTGTLGVFVRFGTEEGGGMIVLHRSGPRQGRAFAIRGPTCTEYQRLDGPGSRLGLPISDTFVTGSGERADFEGGYIACDNLGGGCQVLPHGAAAGY